MKKQLHLALDAEIQASWNPGTPPIPQSLHFPLPTATATSGAQGLSLAKGCAGGCFHHSHRTQGILIIQEQATTDPSSSSQSIRGRHARISTHPFLWHDNDTRIFPDLCPLGGAAGLDRCRQTASNYPPPPRRGSSSLLPITVAKNHPLSALGISKGALTKLLPPPAAIAAVSVHVYPRTNTQEVTDALVTCGEALGELLIAERQMRGSRGQVPLPPPRTGLITSLGFPSISPFAGGQDPALFFLSVQQKHLLSQARSVGRAAAGFSQCYPKMAAGSREGASRGREMGQATCSTPSQALS